MPRNGTDYGTSEALVATDNHYLIWRSWGPEKSGKNHLGLSGPSPIYIHCLDILGLRGTAEKFVRDGKEIRVFKYRFDKNAANSQKNAIAIRDQFLEDLEVSKRNARTIQVDETELWEVFRYAEFGDKSNAPKNYDKLNADYREWINDFENVNCHLQLIQKVKEKWETVTENDRNGNPVSKGRPSGRMEATGFKELRYVAQANIEHRYDPELREFVLHVENCRPNMALAGQDFVGFEFLPLALQIWPKAEPTEFV